MSHHFDTNHANFNTDFPSGSTARKREIESLKPSSLRVMFHLAKKRKPFTDSEVVKECTLNLMDELLAGDKNKDEIVNWVKQSPPL